MAHAFCLNLQQKYDISIYPAYHTGYETFFLVDEYIDPGFKMHESCVRLSGLMLLELVQKPMLPFNASRLADAMSESLGQFKEKNSDALAGKNIRLGKPHSPWLHESFDHILQRISLNSIF